jgi:hypothetical protein
MSNVVELQRVPRRQCAPVPGTASACKFDPDVAPPSAEWCARAIEQIHNSVLLLDLAAQQAHVMTMRISDTQVQRKLIGQLAIVENLLQVVRDMARKL